jgi:dinuclear metal center YbgI/SA1388 family protein
MKISEIIEKLELFAPPGYQENYDNSGLIAGNTSADCTGVLVSLDCTTNVIREAIEKKCNLIVSHHPLIFQGIKNITQGTEQGRALYAAITNEITIYAIHTNLDNIIMGVNASIADKIGLINREILRPRKEMPSTGSGLIGLLKHPVSGKQLLQDLQQAFGIPVIRHSKLRDAPVSRVALCGGAGSFLIINALQAGADFFISADIRYHDFFSSEGKMVIADIGHFESEQFTMDLLCKVILEKYPNFAVLKSGTETNPVNYYI